MRQVRMRRSLNKSAATGLRSSRVLVEVHNPRTAATKRMTARATKRMIARVLRMKVALAPQLHRLLLMQEMKVDGVAAPASAVHVEQNDGSDAPRTGVRATRARMSLDGDADEGGAMQPVDAGAADTVEARLVLVVLSRLATEVDGVDETVAGAIEGLAVKGVGA